MLLNRNSVYALAKKIECKKIYNKNVYNIMPIIDREDERINEMCEEERYEDRIQKEDEMLEELKKKEDEMLVEFVKTTPYPNYKQMLKKLEGHIDLWSEYGEKNHKWCKIIYENPTNKNVIVEMGKNIYEGGGGHTLWMNTNIIKYFSPYWNSTNIIIKMQGGMIEQYFTDAFPEWK